jgi:predicted dehydrogenase
VSVPESGRMRAGVVGAGHMGQYHILALAELWDVELVGICDADVDRAEQIAAQYGTRAVATHHELAGLVDIATVAVPTERHFEVTRDLLEAGVHVLVEKPMTPTLEEAKELFRVARQRARVLHVGHVERFNGAVQELRKIVESPVLIESRRLGPFVPRVQNDSVVMDLMIHDIDIVLGLVDSEPRRMNALGRSIHSSQADVAYIVLNYADQDIQIHRRAAQEYTLNRESIRYRQASFVERLFVHKDNPLKLEIRHLISAARAAKASGQVELAETEDLRSLAVALEIERMFREGRGEIAWPKDLPWSAASR